MASSGTTKNITIADLFDYPTVNPGDGVMRLLIPMYIYPSYFDEGGGRGSRCSQPARRPPS